MKPRWPVAVVVTILFFLTQFALGRAIGVDFDVMTDTTDNVWKGLALRVGLTAATFTVLALWAHRAWGGGVYVQRQPRLPRWMWVIPILMVIASLARIAVNDWGARGGEYVIALAIGVLFVGVAEETTFRGINVRALRGSTSNEVVVMLVSAGLFGLVHAVNILNGASVGSTLAQMGLATLTGLAMYITLRLTGSLLAPILLHALWDFGVLGRVGEAGVVGGVTLIGQVFIFGLALWGVVVVYRSSRRAGETSSAPAA